MWPYLLLQVHSNGYISLHKSQDSGSGSGSGSTGSSGFQSASGVPGSSGSQSASGVPGSSGSQSASGVQSGSGSGSGSKGDITTLFSTMDPLIGVFLTDVDTTAVGDVFYQYVLDYIVIA